jgi:LacI family transcriptional regulator
MSDVAKLAGVATMTVSRVLHGHASVGEETRNRVLKAIAKLNYVPNEVARSLRKGRSRQIGVIVPNLYDPFFAICAHSINMVAQEREYSTLIVTSGEDPVRESAEIRRMLLRHTEGFVIVPAVGKSQLGSPEFQRTPIVTLDRPVARSSFDSVLVHNKKGSQCGIEHLILHGHRHISCLGLADQWTTRQRVAGYRAAMKAAGLAIDSHDVTESSSAMLETMRSLIDRRRAPTALFCCNNLVMRLALHALSTLDVKIPETMALLGFDDFEMADLHKPPISVLRQPIELMGKSAAELLFARLDADDGHDNPRKSVFPVELIVRGSCGAHSHKL